MRSRAVVLAAAVIMAPLGAKAADLVVWWDEGYYAEEAEAVREIIAAFEQETGKKVELVFHPESEHPEAIEAALEAGEPPDFAFGLFLDIYIGPWAFDDRLVDLSDAVIAAFEQGSGNQVELVLHEQAELEEKLVVAIEAGGPPDIAFGILIADHIPEWAFDDRLVDLTDTVGHFSDLFDPDALAWYALINEKTGQRALYALPMGLTSNHVHVWKSLLEETGFTLDDIPKEWNAFWSFWCDQVQPAVRRARGREDIWGVGLNMSGKADTKVQFGQFVHAY